MTKEEIILTVTEYVDDIHMGRTDTRTLESRAQIISDAITFYERLIKKQESTEDER